MKIDNKGRDIFYGIVAIATLIVAIIGATLAYFSVTASSNEGAVNATAATVSITYDNGQQVTTQAEKLVPATFEVVQQVYEANVLNLSAPEKQEELKEYGNACIDSNNREVCSAFRFSVKSSLERTITAVLNSEHNGFTYLSYAVYDVTNKAWLPLSTDGKTYDLSLKTCSNEDEITENDCHETDEEYNTKTYNQNAINSIFGYTLDNSVKQNNSVIISDDKTREYEIVLFIKENKGNQNIDQGQNYRGTIVVEVMDGGINGSGNITGCVGPNCK